MRVFKQKRRKGNKTREDAGWTLEFCDHVGHVRRLGAFNDKGASVQRGLSSVVASGRFPTSPRRLWRRSSRRFGRKRTSGRRRRTATCRPRNNFANGCLRMGGSQSVRWCI